MPRGDTSTSSPGRTSARGSRGRVNGEETTYTNTQIRVGSDTQRADVNMYATAVLNDDAALAFYRNNALVPPNAAAISAAAQRDASIRGNIGAATLGGAAAAAAIIAPPVLSWCLANPVACNRIAIAGGEIIAGDALGPAGLGVGAAGVRAVRSAEEMNAAMRAKGWQPAWSPATPMFQGDLKPGTKLNMVVDKATAKAIEEGKPFRLGGWATFDDVDSVALGMRQRSAITEAFKKPSDGPFFVIEVEVRKPLPSNVGFVGAQPNGATTLRGGGTQAEFLIDPTQRSVYLQPIGTPRLLQGQ